ncbi:hypothetical protein AQJ66_01495 [Streptomyces bungoensis]|uniref:Uncharacterized protein n=1 Tax=Streptomyces bungoensis TaxID=285568 RepID=A0A101TCF3_9ACTN|nr:hypothetical protein [Streptomyces bungoensis]KUN89777.1 hypothetical protein AQJ66_01495 [Streptomyces bungoensis]
MSRRTFTVSFLGVEQPPRQVVADGTRLSDRAWHWDADGHVLRISLPSHGVRDAVTVGYR